MWHDNETTQDLLGFNVHVDLIREVVTDPNLLPITVGLFGDWGSGKTSIMRMLERELGQMSEPNGEQKTICLYFNSWLFEGYDDAKAAIISSVLVQLAEHQRIGSLIRDKAVSLLKSVNWMRVARFGVNNVAVPALLAYATGGMSLVPSLVNSAKDIFGRGAQQPDPSDSGQEGSSAAEAAPGVIELLKKNTEPSGPMDVRTFRERFSEMLNETGISSLVVLIDDLDRCLPERIIDNLEAIKLFLNVERTAFVVGADERIVRHAISRKYDVQHMVTGDQGVDSVSDLVTDYLEKVIQVPYHIPRLSPSEVESYMCLLFCHKGLNQTDFKKCLGDFYKFRQEDRYSTFGYSQLKGSIPSASLSKELDASLRFCSSSANLITEGLKGNPRQIKRFLNAFILRKRLAGVARLQNIKDEVLIKLMILEYSQPRRFEELFRWQSQQDGFPKEILGLEAKEVDKKEVTLEVPPTWEADPVRKWIALEPKLSDVDLRDYFWIARDRLKSTFSDVTLMPPYVRRILENLLVAEQVKLSEAVKECSGLDPAEVAWILEQMKKQAILSPEDSKAISALFSLVGADVPDAAECLSEVLTEAAADKIPPAFGPQLHTLITQKKAIRPVFAKVFEKHTDGQTPFAKALTLGSAS